MNPLDVARIVVVDDDELQLELVRMQLRNAGFENVSAYVDGALALQEVDSGRELVSLVILDLNMPKMDGLEFLKRLKEVEYQDSLLLVSGEDERILESASRLARVYSLNIIGHLLKPIKQAQMDDVLKNWTAPPRLRSPVSKAEIWPAARLAQAIEDHELFNVYQPKICLRSGKLKSVEALVRWRHPEAGVVFPEQFIAVAEDHGLIDGLAILVLEQALSDLTDWQNRGLDISVAVNISMDNLSNRTLVTFLEKKLDEAVIPPEQLILEVTESTLMKDYAQVLDALTRLRLKRIRISIDDFGTGHSSIVQLRDIPFNELKIDRGFVNGAWQNATLRGIVNANLQMARSLNITTVAEGVEDLNDWNFLVQAGCDFAQGYFIAKPMAAEALLPWNGEWEQRTVELLLPVLPESGLSEK